MLALLLIRDFYVNDTQRQVTIENFESWKISTFPLILV